MTGNLERRWLAGLPGAPLVPPSWTQGREWRALVHEVDAQGRDSSRVVTSLEASMWFPPKRSMRFLNIESSAPAIAIAIQNVDPGWAAEPAVQASDRGVTVGDLPLLATTRRVLSDMNFKGTASMGSVAQVSRRHFLGIEGGASALLDLSVTLEAWWPLRDTDPVWNVHTSSSLEQVARAIAEEYLWLLGGKLDYFWVDAVLARQSWGVPKATLDAIGSQIGVTRERARQILGRFDRLVGQRVWPVPPILAEVVESTITADPEKVPGVVTAGGFADDEDWTAKEIASLLEWFGRGDYAQALLEAWDRNETATRERLANARFVRKARSPLGFLNAAAVFDDEGNRIPEDEVVQLAEQAYSRVFREGSWLLAGQSKPTSAEGTVARQLWATAAQSQEEVIEGLERRRIARHADQLPPSDVVMSLLTQCGSLRREGDRWTGRVDPAEPGSLESFLVNNLKEAEGGVLHRDVLLRRASENGLSVVSLHQFMTYSPLVRTVHDTPLLRLAGRAVDPESAEFALRVAEALWKPTELAWRQVNATRMELDLTVGTGLFSSSILNVDAALAGLWPSEGAEIICLCDRDFDGRIRRYGVGNQLIGWMTLLAHLSQQHGFREGGSVVLRLEGDRLTIAELT